MKTVFTFFALLLIAGTAYSQECELPSYPTYRQGQPIYISFEYEGGLYDWDGWIVEGEKRGEPNLTVANMAFLVVSRGTGPFKRPQKNLLQHWETFRAPRGELVPTINNRVEYPSYTASFTKPFKTLVNLSEYYDLRKPGVYTVYWGVKSVCHKEVMFQVIGANAALGTESEMLEDREKPKGRRRSRSSRNSGQSN